MRRAAILISVLIMMTTGAFAESKNGIHKNSFGLSAGAEYHFITGIVSPYAGALAGLEMLADATQTGVDFNLGVFLGVELSALDFLAFFAEYSLLVSFREDGTVVDLGYAHLPTFGLIIYFN